MSEIRRITNNNNVRISSKYYFLSIISEAERRGIIIDKDITKIQFECMSILNRKLEKEFGDYSSSVTQSLAQNVLSSIVYTIGLGIKDNASPEENIKKLKFYDLRDMYTKGRVIINDIIGDVLVIYKQIHNSKCQYHNMFYNYAIEEQIDLFLAKYNPDLFAHSNEDFIIEYPVDLPSNKYIGIEYVREYAKSLYIENWFCSRFPKEEINALIMTFQELGYDSQTNIYHYVLRFAMANLLVNKKMGLDFSEHDCDNLQMMLEKLKENDVKSVFLNAFREQMRKDPFPKPQLQYVEKSIVSLASEIYMHVKSNSLRNLFVPKDCISNKFSITLNGQLSDKNYNEVLKKIVSENDFGEQKNILRDNVCSPSDFIDLISDVKFTFEEVSDILKTLDSVELAIIIKYCNIEYGFQMFEKSCENRFCEALTEVIAELDISNQHFISEVVESLDFNYI